MRKILIAAGLLLALCTTAFAQSNSPVILPSGCGTGNFASGEGYLTIDSAGHLCDSSTTGSIAPSTPGQYTPVSDSAATALTIPTGATYAVVCAEAANHRYTWDGTTTPTASVGQQLLQNACIALTGAATLAAFKIITQTAGGTFTVSYGH